MATNTDFGITGKDYTGRIIENEATVNKGDEISLSVVSTYNNYSWHLDGAQIIYGDKYSKSITVEIAEEGTITISYGPNDRHTRQKLKNNRITLKVKSAQIEEQIEQISIGLRVTDSSGKPKSNLSEVKKGDIIKLSVSNPVKGYSWYADGASLSNKTNTSASATITVTGGTVTVSYGSANQAERQRMKNNKITFNVSKTESPKSISASQTNLQFAADGGMQEIAINAIGGEWSAIASGQGITANRDGNKLKVHVGPNTSEQQRRGTVTCSIVGANNKCTINITQVGKPTR